MKSSKPDVESSTSELPRARAWNVEAARLLENINDLRDSYDMMPMEVDQSHMDICLAVAKDCARRYSVEPITFYHGVILTTIRVSWPNSSSGIDRLFNVLLEDYDGFREVLLEPEEGVAGAAVFGTDHCQFIAISLYSSNRWWEKRLLEIQENRDDTT